MARDNRGLQYENLLKPKLDEPPRCQWNQASIDALGIKDLTSSGAELRSTTVSSSWYLSAFLVRSEVGWLAFACDTSVPSPSYSSDRIVPKIDCLLASPGFIGTMNG